MQIMTLNISPFEISLQQELHLLIVMSHINLSHMPSGLYPSTWPLPLTRQGLNEAARNPMIQPLPSGPVSVKKQHHVPNGEEHAPVIKAEKVCL